MRMSSRAKTGEELVRRVAAALRAAQLYAPGHPLAARTIGALHDTLTLVHAATPSVTIGVVGDHLLVGEVPVPRAADTLGELMRRLQNIGIERIVIERGVEASELMTLVQVVARADGTRDVAAELGRLPHVRVGRLQIEERVASTGGDIATFRKLYEDAVAIASTLWESAIVEGIPDADAARGIVDALADAVAQNRTALIALTALEKYDNYTFTHMVNVAILTMAQARSLGSEGPLLRQIGIAALMHDIGKVNTPVDILNKREPLTEREFAIMRRHPIDGAELLRKTPEIPPLAPVVAFEHHLRADGSGYPDQVSRRQLNLGTMLCGIADVYDAMRSQRVYQNAFPSERILAVLQRNDGTHFDKHLVRRFSQLVGIYPAGSVVRLDTGAVAVVLKPYAPDPFRPRVRVLVAPDGTRLERPYDVDLWDRHDGDPHAIEAPLDATSCDVDPLIHLS